MSDQEQSKKVRLEPDKLDVESLELEELEVVAGGATEDAGCDGNGFLCSIGGNCNCPGETMAATCIEC